MDKKGENQLSMMVSVEGVCSEYTASCAEIPALQRYHTELQGGIVIIREKDKICQAASKGASAQKEKVEDELIALAVSKSGMLAAYGEDIGDKQLTSFGKITKSSLKHMRDNIILNKTQNIETFLKKHTDNLTAYGFDQAQSDTFSAKIKEYEAILGTSGSKTSNVKAANAELKKALKTVNNLLTRKMDKIMQQMKIKNVEFYNRYSEARNIIDSGIRHKPDDVLQSEPAMA